MFEVGQQVVCIDQEGGGRDWWDVSTDTKPKRTMPTLGCIYTVTWIERECDDLWLTLAELHHDDQFCAESFRPVRKTDISIFTAMLSPAPKVTEPA